MGAISSGAGALLAAAAISGGCGAPAHRETPPDPGGPSVPVEDPRLEALDEFLESLDDPESVLRASSRLRGAVAWIGRGEACLHRAAYGEGAQGLRLEADAVFDLASLTKACATAPAVMLLVERGLVELDAPAARYLPEFGVHGKDEVTVLDLLLHRGGLVADNPLADYHDGPELAWERICALELLHPPGEVFLYTDVGYIVLGRLVERVSGRGLDGFCREELFEPLGMRDTAFDPGEELRARAVPTEVVDGDRLFGRVHDPRARALGGVAGHAGLFSTADDLARFARMVLGGGELEGVRLYSPDTMRTWLRPRRGPDGRDARCIGFDVDTRFSSVPRAWFPRGRSFGHTGFTGTSIWMDPGSGGFAIGLTSRLYPDGKGLSQVLRATIGEAAARACGYPEEPPAGRVQPGADVLAREDCARLAGLRVALLCNATSRTRDGRRTLDVLHDAADVELVRVLTPEHGLEGVVEGPVGDTVDARTGLAVFSLYGDTRRPTPEMLADVDAVVFDVQDVGARFYTYVTTLGYLMEAAGPAGVKVYVLDRPNPAGGQLVAGPVADPEHFSFIAYGPLPLVHGMTLGELALWIRGERGVECELEVVRVQGWTPGQGWDETELPWRSPSPNLRNPDAAVLYPGLCLLEACNVSVGRGTERPFEWFGAPWMDGERVAAELAAQGLAGVSFEALDDTPDAAIFAGERCGGVRVRLLDRRSYRPDLTGLALARALAGVHPDAFDADAVERRLHDAAAQAAWRADGPLEELPRVWAEELDAFRAVRDAYRLYGPREQR